MNQYYKIKEPRIAPLLITTRDTVTTQTPKCSFSSARNCSCYNGREPNSCYSTTSFYRRGQDTRIHRSIYAIAKGLTERLCSAIFKEQAKEKVEERCTV
jgi:hypothetical protein